jgi:hypothetical protein
MVAGTVDMGPMLSGYLKLEVSLLMRWYFAFLVSSAVLLALGGCKKAEQSSLKSTQPELKQLDSPNLKLATPVQDGK